jgi:CxxC motif-containing protein
MKKKYIVTLTLEEQAYLKNLLETRKSTTVVFTRAQILQASDQNGPNMSDKEIQKTFTIKTLRQIERARERFVLQGLEIALNGKKQENFTPRKFDGKTEVQILSLRCSEAPEGYSYWTLELLKEKMIAQNYVSSISTETIRQILKKTKLSPGRSKIG